MKRFVSLLCLLACSAALSAGAYLNVNDLDPVKIASNKSYDDVRVLATAEKAVTVEAIPVSREAADGEVFNARLKLGGSGNATYRALSFHGKKGETLVVYLNSSSKTDARQLALVNAATKAEVMVFTAPPDDEAHAGKASCAIPADGTYLLYSKGSGINLYAVICE